MTFPNSPRGEVLAALVRSAEPWHHAFSSSAVISTGVLFLHVASLVWAGGFSLAADRASLFPAHRGDTDRADEWHARAAHRKLATLAMAFVLPSGLLLFLSDVDAFAHLWTFWLKMGLVTLLGTNSLLAQRYDRQQRSVGAVGRGRNAGPGLRCRVYAGVSVTLWFLTILAGTALIAG